MVWLRLFLALSACMAFSICNAQSDEHPIEKTGKTLEHGAEATGRTLKHGAVATARTIGKGAKKTGQTLEHLRGTASGRTSHRG